MNITVINGTNRKGNKSIKISEQVHKIAQKIGHDSSLVTLNNFMTLFTGEHVTFKNATSEQTKDLKVIQNAAVLFFVVPIYNHSMPAPLKNFIDIVDEQNIYEDKVIGLISSNSGKQIYGAYHAQDAINGILSYHKLHSIIAPRITTIDYDSIDNERIESFIEYCISLKKHISR